MKALRLTILFLALALAGGETSAQQACCAANGGVTATCSAAGYLMCQDGTVSTCACPSGLGPPPSGLGQLGIVSPPPFGSVTVGATTTPAVVQVTNNGVLPVTVSSIASVAPNEFIVTGHSCAKISGGASCTIGVAFRPAVAALRSTNIVVVSNGTGSPQSFLVIGTGVAAGGPPPGPGTPTVEIVEYRQELWGHYFVTSLFDEISKLDNGAFAGWNRTGLKFKAYPNGTGGTASVCRFFSTAFPRSSHFYTPVASECTAVKANPSWSFEGEVFGVVLPSPGGACPDGTVPLYRLYNNGEGASPNHRYTTEFAVRSIMQVFGWLSEGYGPLGVIACVPE